MSAAEAELGHDLRRVARDLAGLEVIHDPAGDVARTIASARKALGLLAAVLAPTLDDALAGLADGSRLLLERQGGRWTVRAECADESSAVMTVADQPTAALEEFARKVANWRRAERVPEPGELGPPERWLDHPDGSERERLP